MRAVWYDRQGPARDVLQVGELPDGAQTYRALGTAAELVAVPAHQAVPLSDGVPDKLAACLGIPGITAHRCVFADGPVTGRTVLVQGPRTSPRWTRRRSPTRWPSTRPPTT